MTQLYCKVGKAPPSWSEGVTYPFTVYTARINPGPLYHRLIRGSSCC